MSVNRVRTAWRRGFAGLAMAGALLASVPALADFKLTILHTDNMLSRLEPVMPDGSACTPEQAAGDQCQGGAARLAGQIQLERAAARHVLLLDAGNQFTGSDFWNRHKDQPIVDIMNRLHFDAMAVGAAEFADGAQTLGGFVRAARFPLMGANVQVGKDPYLKDQIFPILAMERGDRLALIGIGDERTPQRGQVPPGIRFERAESALPFWIRQLGHMRIDKVIAVSHAGIERDKEIAQRVPGIDIIIGESDTDTSTTPYPLVVKGSDGRTVLLAQAGRFGRNLGKLEVTFGPGGGLKKWEGKRIALDRKVPEDPEIRAVVQTFGGQLAAK